MTFVPTAHVAAHLRRQLKAAFSGVKFSVRTSSSTWIDVTWTNGPDEDAVKKLTAPLRGSRWDSYTNKYIRAEQLAVETKDGTVTGEPLVEGIHVRRTYSDAVLAEATELWLTHHDRTDIEVARLHWQDAMSLAGENIRPGPVDAQIQAIAARVVLASAPAES